MVPQVVKKIRIDVHERNNIPTIYAKQYDTNSRFICAQISEDNQDIVIAQSSKVFLNACREDDDYRSFSGIVNDDGSVTVPLEPCILEFPGTVKCDILIEDSGSRLSTLDFLVIVKESYYNGDFIDTNYDIATIKEVKEYLGI